MTGKPHSRVAHYIGIWRKRGYSDDIPDEVPEALAFEGLAPSYKAICVALLKNDLWLTALGYSAPKSEAYGAIKRMEKRV